MMIVRLLGSSVRRSVLRRQFGDSGRVQSQGLSDSLFAVIRDNPTVFSRELIQTLVRIALNDPSLSELDLALRTLGDTGAEAVAEALKSNTVLASLDLTSAEIGDRGVQCLAEALCVNSSLRHLDLQCNNFGEAGVRALADTLAGRNASLTSLRVFSTNTGDAGAAAVAAALSTNTTLRDLALGSGITDQGATALSQALRRNGTLTALSLHSNDIADDGALAIADALSENVALATLNLEFNRLTDVGRQALQRVQGDRLIIFDDDNDDDDDDDEAAPGSNDEKEQFDVRAWLASLGSDGECLAYWPVFVANHLTDRQLICKLSSDDLKTELGIQSLGHRLLIMDGIERLA